MEQQNENLQADPQTVWTTPDQTTLTPSPIMTPGNSGRKKLIIVILASVMLITLSVGGYIIFKKSKDGNSAIINNESPSNSTGYLKIRNLRTYFVGEYSNTSTMITGEIYNDTNQALAPLAGEVVVTFESKGQEQKEKWGFGTSKEVIRPGEKAYFVALPPRIKKVTLKSFTIELKDEENKQSIKSENAQNANFLAYKRSNDSISCHINKNDYSLSFRPVNYEMNGTPYSNLLAEITYTGKDFDNFSGSGKCTRSFPPNAKIVEFNNEGQVVSMYLESFDDNSDGTNDILKNPEVTPDYSKSFKTNPGDKISKGSKFYSSLRSIKTNAQYGKDFIIEFMY